MGAQSQVMQFDVRNVGSWTSAGIGAWGADKVVGWAEQNQINTKPTAAALRGA